MHRLGPFELVRPVGKGGMATVWRGIHRHTTTPVAIKIMDEAPVGDASGWFDEEVRVTARLRHPAVAMVLDHGTVPEGLDDLTAGVPWLAMEFASGGPVHTLRSTPWNWPMLKALLLSVLDALGHAHAHGLVHRDVKLGNEREAAELDALRG